jgi:hypothetical protein
MATKIRRCISVRRVKVHKLFHVFYIRFFLISTIKVLWPVVAPLAKFPKIILAFI